MGQIIFIILYTVFLSVTSWAGSYKLDESHTQVGFKIKHLMISTVSGRFNKFSGTFNFDEKKGQVTDLQVSIEASSVDTNESDRDKHLRSKDFFEVEKFPKITFVSKKTIVKSGKPQKLEGLLTIRDVQKPVVLDLDYKGTAVDPWGTERIVFEASTQINRKDFGLTWNQKLDKGGVMIADEVKIHIEGEALVQQLKPK